jgi:PleD family two-component response regulator
MTPPSEPHQFAIILEFAAGIADRGIPLSLVLVEPDAQIEPVDLDRFAAHVATRIRRSDRFTRLSETRFAALLVDCNRQGAMIFADRLQSIPEVNGLDLTLSCGIASWSEPMKAYGDLVSAAEGALDLARAAGGGAIEVHLP